MRSDELVIESKTRTVRTKFAASALPIPQVVSTLTKIQTELLTAWVQSDGVTRKWTDILALGGPQRIELSESLLLCLLKAKLLQIKERLYRGTWHIESLTWLELPSLKEALGQTSLSQRKASRQVLLESLRQWSVNWPIVEEAAASLHAVKTLSLENLEKRTELLKAIVEWHQNKRSGTVRDFALSARQDTKGITQSEWNWLETHIDLESIGIEKFAPRITLAGTFCLEWQAGHRVDLSPLHFAELPSHDFEKLSAAKGIEQYWLIENRASFERQAKVRQNNLVLVWIPGRPSHSWQAAISRLLQVAPFPALISADPDPAGVEIAMAVGQIWSKQDQPWRPHMMGEQDLLNAPHKKQIDHAYDQRVLASLLQTETLHPDLKHLCDSMMRRGIKAEQEGWI